MPDIFLESLKACGQLALPVLQTRTHCPGVVFLGRIWVGKDEDTPRNKDKGAGASFLGRALPNETAWQGTVISGVTPTGRSHRSLEWL